MYQNKMNENVLILDICFLMLNNFFWFRLQNSMPYNKPGIPKVSKGILLFLVLVSNICLFGCVIAMYFSYCTDPYAFWNPKRFGWIPLRKEIIKYEKRERKNKNKNLKWHQPRTRVFLLFVSFMSIKKIN